MTSKVISVIIPCYNTEKYIDECLDSVVKQTYKNLEIICVNDGSTDGTLDRLKYWSTKDSRIIIVDQENKGPGSTRENGFHKSTGDYIINIDSDDYFSTDSSIEYMMKKHDDNLDVTSFTFRPYYDGTHQGFFKYSVLNRIRMYIPFSRKLMKYNWYMWAKIFSREYYSKCTFDNRKKGEDRQFFIDNHTCSFKVVNKSVVRYRVRKNSIMRKVDND